MGDLTGDLTGEGFGEARWVTYAELAQNSWHRARKRGQAGAARGVATAAGE